MPELIAVVTPDFVKTCTGFDREGYELILSDEFEVDKRTAGASRILLISQNIQL